MLRSPYISYLSILLVALMGVGNSSNPSPERKEIMTNKLQVNLENKERFVFKGSQQIGEDQLHRLAENSLYEEMWAFVPEKSRWIEIGKDERSTYYIPRISRLEDNVLDSMKLPVEELPEISSSCKIDDQKYYERLIRNNNSIIFYHIHPSGREVIQKLMEAAHKNESKLYPNKDQYIERLTETVSVLNCIASDGDIEFFSKSVRRAGKLNPKCKIGHRSFAAKGICDLSITESGTKHIHKIDSEEFYYLVSDVKSNNANILDDMYKENRYMTNRFSKDIYKGMIKFTFIPRSNP